MVDSDPHDNPDPSVFEAIKRNNNKTARDRTKAILDAPETKHAQSYNRGHGTITVTKQRIIEPEAVPSLGAAGYSKATFSRIYDYNADRVILPPDVMGVEAIDAATGITEAYVILDFGIDENGEENIVVGVEDEGKQLSFGFSKEEPGELTDDIEDYDSNEPDGFISDMREVTATERAKLEAVLNASEGR